MTIHILRIKKLILFFAASTFYKVAKIDAVGLEMIKSVVNVAEKNVCFECVEYEKQRMVASK